MRGIDVFLVLALLGVIVFQAWVTWKVRRSDDYDTGQKNAQTKLIWMLPLLGAAIAFAALEPEEDRKSPTDSSQR